MRHYTEKGYAGNAEDRIPYVVMIGMPGNKGVNKYGAAKREANKSYKPQHRDHPAEKIIFAALRPTRQFIVVQHGSRLNSPKHCHK